MVLGAKVSTGILGALRAEKGGGGALGDERRPWLAALLAITSSAFANHGAVGRERRWP